jgi:hypothetical protein
MNSEALDTLPVVVCPGCEEPMQPKGSMPVTRELYDISYILPEVRCQDEAHLEASLDYRSVITNCSRTVGSREASAKFRQSKASCSYLPMASMWPLSLAASPGEPFIDRLRQVLSARQDQERTVPGVG